MAQVLCHLPKFQDPNLIVGFDTSDDASVYKIDDNTALIQTVDIFPPVVDDPYEYGRIAAVNSLSDVYAMGGKPKLAMNIFCFPEDLPKDAVQAILQGGYEMVAEAEAIITGGHTIKDPVPKYGLSVTGFAHPSEILTNKGAKPGDILILTKALGTGILTTASTADMLEAHEYKELIDSMSMLNKYAAEVMGKFSSNSCTDVTGFGFLGHAFEMSYGSGCTIRINSSKLPMLSRAKDMARMGIIPAGAYSNRKYLEDKIKISEGVPLEITDIMFDPQTSGGLLISIPEKEGLKLTEALKDILPVAEIVGSVEEYREHSIIVE